MRDDEQGKRYGVHDTVFGLHDGLRQYIEAQYHIRDEALVSERTALLQQPQVIAQKAFVEATPVYAFGNSYEKLAIPERAQKALFEIAAVSDNSGLYPTPYKHQADALEAFLGAERKDLVVATGTGSGKTESFLMPIVGTLAIESEERLASRSLPGCRAILLYPMNALVNDQVARIRRLLGNPRVSRIVSEGRDRPVRFGSYTGRTPYPGPRSSGRDSSRIAPLFEDFYNKIEEKPELKAQLQKVGRWPSKDLHRFYNAEAIEKKVYKSGAKQAGKEYFKRNWQYRLITQPDDREMMTRHEMQKECPDILVTNYSMLEYMLMRPVERRIFEDTERWLKADERNELILVLDEAHMYRGAGGAEVALLIRRLIARLGISRSRVRCILTSASLGDKPDDIRKAEQFAIDLTGSSDATGSRQFKVVKGTLESRPEGRPASQTEIDAFHKFQIDRFTSEVTAPSGAFDEVRSLAARLGWSVPPEELDDIPDYLFGQLSKLGPIDLLVNHVSGHATALDVLTTLLCPDSSPDVAERVIDSVLALCSHAKRKDGRVLLPTRLHLFHRGLPGLYACVDPNCTERLVKTGGASILGRFHTKPMLSCTCETKARVYDFYTHRDCGAAFITGWIDENVDFVWHTPERLDSRNKSRKLYPVEILVESKAHSSSRCSDAWLHLETGRLVRARPSVLQGFRHVRIPDKDIQVSEEMTFDECPVCCRRTRKSPEDPSKIMDHITKGEAPFATLVRAQMFHQPPSRRREEKFPNAGRKVLVFSDGRQKAARLARDMPRDMELDLFRQAVAVAAKLLTGIKRETKPTETVLYVAFLAVLAANNVSMFDGADAEKLDQHINAFRRDFGEDLQEALTESFHPGEPPSRYRFLLLKLLCSSYYSLSGTTIGFVEPGKLAFGKLVTQVEGLGLKLNAEQIRGLSVAWIDELLGDFSFEVQFVARLREKAYGFYRPHWGSKGQFSKQFRRALMHGHNLQETDVKKIEDVFCAVLAENKEGFYLNPNALKLSIDLEHKWAQCGECTSLMPITLDGACISCGSRETQLLDPASDPYLKARKSFWRLPVALALAPDAVISNMSVEEHTAQLSNRDYRNVHSTTELHELRFQDILLAEKDRPVDVLSCTTTMEVGIDIGSLVAVALRNVPPQRENYQQRAGRAGRRGSSVSSVVAFSQNGPHDSYYFLNAARMVAGPPRSPELKTDNPKIAIRHVHAFLIQTFFQDPSVEGAKAGSGSAILQKALGRTRDFFIPESDGPNFSNFDRWMEEKVFAPPHPLARVIADWLPGSLNVGTANVFDWVLETSRNLIVKLRALAEEVRSLPSPGGDDKQVVVAEDGSDEANDEDADERQLEQEDLLEYLFFHQLLPTYAFPTSLCSFLVEEWKQNSKGYSEIKLEQQPQQSTGQALSEYAPGRLVVINKETYRSGGVFASGPASDGNRAAELFEANRAKWLVICEACSFVQNPYAGAKALVACPVCEGTLKNRLMIQPEVFGPEKARALSEEDRDQEFTYATMAQFPQPTDAETFDFNDGGSYLRYAHAEDRRLLTLNKGKTIEREGLGFSVCRKCGCAEVFDEKNPKSGKHSRPYLVAGKDIPRDCSGDFVQTFLGYDFSTDLLLLRFEIAAPLVTDVASPSVVQVLESAAYSLAEALRLAASRHQQLDLDPTEFGSGHRILPPNAEGRVSLDIYLYDTLSGGAGYAELAAKYFREVVEETLSLLEGCDCDTSCTDCLDHFHNQHLKPQLDRKLAAALLRYGMFGTFPKSAPPDAQALSLRSLASSLELDGIACEFGASTGGERIPLRAKLNSRTVSINLYPSLLAMSDRAFDKDAAGLTYQLTEGALRRDLPAVHAEVRRKLA
ncbi:helicase-like protein [Paraburkholderia sp. BL23I1N1]|uniref:DEAD/DEAH box helicase n=1 Tax=Paraburkholderia sp. BL23I1N1 TaxID=1938802 RepID=UPI000E72CA52|nr:DEAD/DEAH box helicase [Paraburkholderia sp. BL23I1N1]RKE25913.1 helicase-like protein [Paraburkholderia sp. BL23I1N1]